MFVHSFLWEPACLLKPELSRKIWAVGNRNLGKAGLRTGMMAASCILHALRASDINATYLQDAICTWTVGGSAGPVREKVSRLVNEWWKGSVRARQKMLAKRRRC